ncbi:hypothetical protein ACTFIW_002987 [Dictyostelium discoideum]
MTLQALDHLRRRIAKDLNLIPNGAMVPVWITDIPFFSWNEEFDRIESEHHPFTSPHLLDLGFFERFLALFYIYLMGIQGFAEEKPHQETIKASPGQKKKS